MLLKRFIHEMQGVIGKDISGVPFLIGMQMVNRCLGAGQHFLVIKKHRAVLEHGEIGIDKIARPVKTIKATGDGRLLWLRSQMPLASHHRAVPALPEALGQSRYVGQDGAAVAGNAPIPGHVAHARLMLVHPAQQRRARGAAAAGVVKLGKAQPIGRKLVQRWCLDLATVTTEI